MAFFGKLATAFVGLLLAGLLARLLPPAEMGLYFLAFNLATFFSILGRGGLENTLLRYIAQANGTQQKSRLRSILQKGLILSLAGAVAAGGLAAILMPTLGEHIFESQGLVAIAWLLGGWVALLAIQFIFAAIFHGFQEIGRSVWFGGLITGTFTVALLGIAAALGLRLELRQVLQVILLALLVNNAIAITMQRNRAKKIIPDNTGHVGYVELIDHSWPLLINAVTLFLITQSDLWLLGAYASEQEVAIYGAARRLIMLTTMSLTIVNIVVPPLIARMHAQNDLARLEKLLRTVATISAIPSLGVLCLFMLFGARIMELIYGDYYRNGGTVLLILGFAQVVNVLVGSCGYALVMTGNRKTIMAISIVSAGVAIGLGLYLVQNYGLIGLAIAYACATIIQQMGMWLFAYLQTGLWTHAGLTFLQPSVFLKLFWGH